LGLFAKGGQVTRICTKGDAAFPVAELINFSLSTMLSLVFQESANLHEFHAAQIPRNLGFLGERL